MSAKLEVLKAELEQLEANDAYDHPAYDWLVEQVDRLEREEKAKPPAQTPTTQPAEDPVAALVAEMNEAAANPGRYTDEQMDALVRRYNAAVVAVGQTQRGERAERVDVAALTRDMVAADADPYALSHDERARLVDRYNAAVRQGPERRTTEVLGPPCKAATCPPGSKPPPSSRTAARCSTRRRSAS